MNGPSTVTGANSTRTATKPRTTERPRPEPTSSGLIVLTYLRLHWLMILFCGTLLGSVLAYAAYVLLPTKYESYALVLVSSTPPTIASQTDPTRGRTEFATYIKTNAQLIKSEFVLNAALNDAKYRIGELTTLKEQKDPIRFLDEKLMVTFSDSSEVVRISLEGDRPEEIRKIVDAVKDAFFSEVVEKEIKQKAYLKEKVEAARTALESQMRGKPGFAVEPKLAMTPAPQAMPSVMPAGGPNAAVNSQPVQQVSGVVPVPTGAINAVVSNLDSDVVKRAKFNANMQRYTQYEVELAQFPTLIRERQADIELIKKQIEKWRAAPPLPEVMVMVEKDPEVMAMKASVKRQNDEYNYLKNVANNPNSDRLERLREKVQSAEAELQKLMHEKATLIDGVNRRAEGDRLTRNLEAAERGLRQLEERERVTRKLFEDAKRELAETPPELRKEEAKKPLVDPNATDLLTHDDMYRRLTSQLISLDLDLKSPPRVRPLQSASLPSQKDPKKQIIATVGAGLLGFVLIGLGVVAVESRAKRISSLDELTSQCHTPVIGVLPWSPDGEAESDPMRWADLLEAIDKLRGQVVQSYLSRGQSIITLTSPLSDEGKGFTAFHLAKSLTEVGTRTLLVDFDLRKPTLHLLAGIENTEGMCELLCGNISAIEAQVILPSGLTFIPAGRWAEDARRAALSGKIDVLLKNWQAQFDCVILHGHTLLTVAESVEVARRSSSVILCTLYRETRLPLLKRALERLHSMNVQNIGVVYLGASSQEALC